MATRKWFGPQRKADQRRLDHVLPIDEVVAVRLVDGHVNASAEFGQDQHAQIFILQMDRLPGAVDRRIGDAVNEGQRIDAPGGSLVDALFEKHRIALAGQRLPGRDTERALPGLDRSGEGCGRRRKLQCGQNCLQCDALKMCAHHLPAIDCVKWLGRSLSWTIL